MRQARRSTQGKDEQRLTGARAPALPARPTLLLYQVQHDRIPVYICC